MTSRYENEFSNRKEATEFFAKEFKDVIMHSCIIVGGRKLPKGAAVDCTKVSANPWFSPTALCYYKGKQVWIDPKWLKATKALPKATVDRYLSEREAWIGEKAAQRAERKARFDEKVEQAAAALIESRTTKVPAGRRSRRRK